MGGIGRRARRRAFDVVAVRPALLVLLAVTLLAGGSPACSAAPAPVDPVPSPTPAVARTATPAPEPALDDDVLSELRAIANRVSELRGLEGDGREVARLVDDAELDLIVAGVLEEPEAVYAMQVDERLYRLLGLIAPEMSLERLYHDHLGAHTLGLYVPGSGELVVRVHEELAPRNRSTFAHEYVHYLQDLHFDLRGLVEASGGNRDRQLALSALVEGDAVLTQSEYVLRELGGEAALSLVREAEAASSAGGEAPSIVRQLVRFPYVYGLRFATQLREQGGIEALNEAFANPPVSTSQIMHPQLYLDGIEPAVVELPDLADALGPGWEPAGNGSFGEFFLRAWLVALGAPNASAGSAAVGWSGDSFGLVVGPEGSEALAARIKWTERGRREDFAAALTGTLADSARFRAHPEAPSIEGATLWDAPASTIGVMVTAQGDTLIAAAPSAAQTETLLRSLLEAG